MTSICAILETRFVHAEAAVMTMLVYYVLWKGFCTLYDVL